MSANRGAYLMAKMTSKGATPGMIFGGVAEVDRMDVAAACSTLGRLEYRLVRIKYCNDVASVAEAVRSLEEMIEKRSRKFAELDQPTRGAMAAALLMEFVSDRRCRPCGGTGSVINDHSQKVECKGCEGSGKRKASTSGRARAKQCRIPESTWRHKQMNEEFDRMAGMVEAMELGALSQISNQLPRVA